MAATHLAVPRWLLVQVGMGRAPLWEPATDLIYEPVANSVQLHNGATVDYWRNQRAPLQPGKFTHTGRYYCCDSADPCTWIMPELDFLQQAKGMYVPCLFARDYSSCEPSPDCCYIKPKCWTFAWAYGKLNGIDNPMAIEDYESPASLEISLDGQVESPLRDITWARWRYGDAINRIALRAGRYDPMSLERVYAEPKAQWFVPCTVPSPRDPERFFPRDLNADLRTTEAVLLPENWDSSWRVHARAPYEGVLKVWGNTAPRTQALMSGDAIFTLTTQLGEQTYDVGLSGGERVYTDTDTGWMLRQVLSDGTVEPYAGACALPRLDHFENGLRVERGSLWLAATQQWIN